MKKHFFIFYVFLIVVLSSAYAFPDKTPDWKDIKSYTPQKLKFHKTTVRQFKQMGSCSKPTAAGKGILIFSATPAKTDIFKAVNIGFRNQTFDWLEFMFNKQVEMKDITAIYGLPGDVDTKYSKDLDYYNYENFNISTDKKHTFARSISVFATGQTALNASLRDKITTAGSRKFFFSFPELKPGVTTESAFKTKYPALLPYMEGENDITSTYTLVDELGSTKHYYKKALLRFENGILTWIDLFPTDAEAKTILKMFKPPYKIEKMNAKYDFYNFDNFVLVVDRKQKTVKSIGLTNFDKRF